MDKPTGFQFEVYTGRNKPNPENPILSIQARGTISLNKLAHNLLGSPAKVIIMFDREKNVLGLRVPEDETDAAYPLKKAKSGSSYTLNATGPLRFFGIPFVRSRYRTTVEDGVLIAYLSEPLSRIADKEKLQIGEKDND